LIPVRLAPGEDEILSSWLIRNAVANGTDPLGFAENVWWGWRPWTVDFARHTPDARLRELADATGMGAERLRRMTLAPAIRTVLGFLPDRRKAWPWVVPLGTRNRYRTGGLHFCPACLESKTPYMKRAWRLSWNVACPVHGILLETRCPECGLPFSPHLVDYRRPDFRRCTRCGYDLRRVPAVAADPDTLAVQGKMTEAAAGSDPEGAFSEIRDFVLLFRNARRLRGPLPELASRAGIDPEAPEVMRERGVPFDAASAPNRGLFLKAGAALAKDPASRIAELFRRAGLTRKYVLQLCPARSEKMGEVLRNLPGPASPDPGGPRRGSPGCRRSPRSREEVEKAMDEIRRYL